MLRSQEVGPGRFQISLNPRDRASFVLWNDSKLFIPELITQRQRLREMSGGSIESELTPSLRSEFDIRPNQQAWIIEVLRQQVCRRRISPALGPFPEMHQRTRPRQLERGAPPLGVLQRQILRRRPLQ